MIWDGSPEGFPVRNNLTCVDGEADGGSACGADAQISRQVLKDGMPGGADFRWDDFANVLRTVWSGYEECEDDGVAVGVLGVLRGMGETYMQDQGTVRCLPQAQGRQSNGPFALDRTPFLFYFMQDPAARQRGECT